MKYLSSEGAARPFMKYLTFLLCGAAIVIAVLTAGFLSEVSLGDESFHYRTAKNYLNEGRKIHDPIYRSIPELAYVNTVPPLWHQGLALVWKLTAPLKVPMPRAAQTYQALFFAGFLAVIYALMKSVGDEEEGKLSFFLAATCPLILLYSVLFYVDMPALFFGLLALWMLSRKQFILAGFAWAAFALTKETAFLFLPSIFIFLFTRDFPLKEKIKGALKFSLAAFIFLVPDILYRWKEIGYIYINPTPKGKWDMLDSRFSPLSFSHQPLICLLLFGAFLPIGILAFFKNHPRNDHQKLWFALGVFYTVVTFGMFWGKSFEIRYLLPAVPLFIMASAYSLRDLANRHRKIFIGICFLQLFVTLGLAVFFRQIPQGIKKGFEFLKKNTSSESVIFYPEENLMTYTGRPMVWGQAPDFYGIFWGNEPEAFNALKLAHADYVAIPLRRVYDDAREGKHWGGYPRSFVTRINEGQLPFLTKVYANSDIVILKVKSKL